VQSVAPEQIRNVALVGHSGAGKTTLAEALLAMAGATTRIGRVEDGTTVSDADPEERRRGISLSSAILPFAWREHKINLIDTPGYADFAGEVHAALRVADLAVFVVSAVDGVEAQTEAVWRMAAAVGLPRLVFVNKLDRERADFDRVLQELRGQLGSGVAPLELPIGREAGFSGVIDLLTDTAWTYADGVARETPIPDDMDASEHEVHDALVEGIVVADDELLERYLEGEVPSFEVLEHTLAHGVDVASVFPVVCGSATTRIGLDRLADFICEIGPSPLDRPPVPVTAGDTTVEIAPDPAGPPLAFVFKTVADQFVGQLSVCKLLSGSIHADDHLVNSRTGDDLRLHALVSLRGHEREPVTTAVAGDIVAVANLSGTATGDTLAPKGMPVRVAPIEQPEALLGLGIRARTQGDDDKLATALHRLLEEDPALRVERNDETHQTILQGVGDVHVAVALERLERAFGVAVDTEPVRVPFRQTATTTVELSHRHAKQSGGHGQFADCRIRLSPLPRGEGFEFTDQVTGGAISKKYIPAVRKGIEEGMAPGSAGAPVPPLGYPIVDIRVELLDGKEHPVDSSEMAFRTAGRGALHDAMAQAAPVLLEPVSRVVVIVPSDLQGAVLGDLNARRGQVQGTDAAGAHEHAITALVPDVELHHYAIDLRSLTGGRGRFTRRPDHYEIAPPGVAGSERPGAPAGRSA